IDAEAPLISRTIQKAAATSMLLAVEQSDLAITLGAAAAAAAGAWVALVAVLAVATRAKQPTAVPAGLEVGGDEPPAVVNLIANGWKVRGEALSSTLVDLAARHVLRFEEPTPGQL